MENKKKKILVIDDSALMRRVISDIINSDERMEVSDQAKNGLEGLELLQSGRTFDLIILDINMPKMDGVAFLEQLLILKIEIKVLVVSSIASKSTVETIRALELGAFDFVKKPDRYIGATQSDFKDVLLTKISFAVLPDSMVKETVNWNEIKKISEHKRKESIDVDILHKKRKISGEKLVFIACSTGGPKSLQKVVPMFPANFPYPIVIVQHMPEGFTLSLAKRLDEMSPLSVVEMQEGDRLERGKVYIAKGGHHCYLVQQGKSDYRFALTKEPARNGLRPCADVFIESLVETSFDEIVCSVLTGMGDDATRGLMYLQEFKDISVIAQNQETCVVYGMPKAIYATGIVDQVVALDNITNAIIKKAGE